MKKALSLLALVLISPLALLAAAPVVHYTDLASGPNTGGKNGNGVFLTLYGAHFGDTQSTSTVKIGGGLVAAYDSWSDTEIVVEPGAAAATGQVVVTVGGVASTCDNPTDSCDFTVRAGSIFFLSNSGTQYTSSTCRSHGTYADPWGVANVSGATTSTINLTYLLNNCAQAGDTLYMLTVSQNYDDGQGWHEALTPRVSTTTAANPIALISYPGTRSTINSPMQDIMRCAGGCDYMAWGKIDWTNSDGAGSQGDGITLGAHNRLVDSTLSCLYCDQPSAALLLGDYDQIYGDTVNCGENLMSTGTSKEMHYLYGHTIGDDIGWDVIGGGGCYNGIQLHFDSWLTPTCTTSSTVRCGTEGDLIHDNLIYGVYGSGINLAEYDFKSSDPIKVYNNAFVSDGKHNSETGAAGDPHNCIALKAGGGSFLAGTIVIQNNSFYNCGSEANEFGNSDEGAVQTSTGESNVTVSFINNSIQELTYTNQGSNPTYISGSGTAGIVGTCSNNLWNGGQGTVCGSVSTADPLYLAPATNNLAPEGGSPLLGAGTTTGAPSFDRSAYPRPSPPAIGAYELDPIPPATGPHSRPFNHLIMSALRAESTPAK